jgi:CHAT domain-containing protein
MAALHDGERWLVESHPTALISGAGLLEGAGLADGGAEPMMAALGVSRPVGGFAALPAVTAEIEALIRDETNPEGFYPGVKILDESFTYERLRQVLADRPAYVHLASHFLFDPGDHRASRLLLGDGGQLSLARLDYDGSLSFKGIRHISLSACQTAVGEISDDGREVESLGSLIHRKGAGSVLASLWRVDDASTMRLMESFYGLQKSGLANRAEALRAAQLAFVEGGGAASGGGPTRGAVSVAETPAEASGPDPSHPYYWAPFIIMGDFR